jgi:hypothetical protein
MCNRCRVQQDKSDLQNGGVVRGLRRWVQPGGTKVVDHVVAESIPYIFSKEILQAITDSVYVTS